MRTKADTYCLVTSMVALCALGSCAQSYTASNDETWEKTLDLHNLQCQYHFEKDSMNFAAMMVDNFVSAQKGSYEKRERD